MNWRGRLRLFFRIMRRILGGLLLLVLAGFLYLSSQGVPRPCTERWLGALRTQGYYATVDRIRLDLLEGVVAERLRVFEDEAHRRPMLEAERVALFLDPRAWFRHQIGLRRLQVSRALLRLDLAETPSAAEADTLTLRNLNGSVILGADAWEMREVNAELLGIKIDGRGRILLPNPKSEIQNPASSIQHPASPPSPPGSAVTRRLNALSRSQRERIRELIRQLNAITFGAPPHAEIGFQLDLANPEASSAAIRMEGAGLRARAVRLDRWRIQAELKSGRLELIEANLQRQDQHLTCAGAYTFATQMAEARLHGRLVLNDWLPLAPETWRQALADSGCVFDGPLQGAIRLEPAPLDQALEHVQGWLSLAQLDVKGLWIEQGIAGFALGSNSINLDPLFIVLGRGAELGSVQGQLNYAWDTGDYEGQLETGFVPRALAPLLGSNLTEYADAFVFQAGPPACSADFSGRADRPDSFWIAGGIQASNFIYNAVPLTSLGARFDYAAGVLAFDQVRVARPEGAVTGRIATRLDEPVLALDLVSMANPQAVAGLIGPSAAGYLDGFYFAGPMRLAARGKIDYDTGALTDLQAEFDGRNWGYRHFHVARGSLKTTVKQLRFDLDDIRGEALEGAFTGQASFYPTEAGSNFAYNLSVKVADINLNTLLQVLGYEGREEYEGIISSEWVLAGALGAGRGKSASGGGWIRIQDGQLYRLRLLGGLSRLVSVIAPGLGVINLTDFSANCAVSNGQINTRDALLSGPTLAIHAEGYYAFDQHLDFIVWAQAAERKQLLAPLFPTTRPILPRLLAMRLTGTLNDPKWWPLNLTKDQLLALPKDLLVTLPADVLRGLPKELLVTLPHEVLVTLPHEVLVTLPREILVTLPRKIFIDLPEELFIKLPRDLWEWFKPVRPEQAKP